MEHKEWCRARCSNLTQRDSGPFQCGLHEHHDCTCGAIPVLGPEGQALAKAAIAPQKYIMDERTLRDLVHGAAVASRVPEAYLLDGFNLGPTPPEPTTEFPPQEEGTGIPPASGISPLSSLPSWQPTPGEHLEERVDARLEEPQDPFQALYDTAELLLEDQTLALKVGVEEGILDEDEAQVSRLVGTRFQEALQRVKDLIPAQLAMQKAEIESLRRIIEVLKKDR